MSISKPVQISEFKLTIKELSDDEIIHIRTQLINTINKLNELILLMFKEMNVITTNYHKNASSFRTEESLLNDDDDTTKEYKSDMQLYTESIQENKIVIKNNYQRFAAVEEEIQGRGVQLPSDKPEVLSLELLSSKLQLTNEEYLAIKDKDHEVFEINEPLEDGYYIWEFLIYYYYYYHFPLFNILLYKEVNWKTNVIKRWGFNDRVISLRKFIFFFWSKRREKQLR